MTPLRQVYCAKMTIVLFSISPPIRRSARRCSSHLRAVATAEISARRTLESLKTPAGLEVIYPVLVKKSSGNGASVRAVSVRPKMREEPGLWASLYGNNPGPAHRRFPQRV